jgi:hypothetical protein
MSDVTTDRFARITIHDLTTTERELLGGLWTNAGAVADERFTLAVLASAAARGIRAHSAIGLTAAGVVVWVPIADG